MAGMLADVAELVRVSQGIWRPESSIADLPGRCAALLDGCPDATVVAGIAAARLHGLWLPQIDDQRIELILRVDAPVPRGHAGCRRREIRGRRRIVRRDEVTVTAGLPVTSMARTWLDLAERLPLRDLIAAGDCALRQGVSYAELHTMIGRARHRRGVVAARIALPHLDGRSRSRPESHLRHALVSAGLPKPEVNTAIHSDVGEWLA